MKITTRRNNKELLLVLSGEEIPNFDGGKSSVKESCVQFGEFDVTVIISRNKTVHKNTKTGISQVEKNGKYVYRGFTIVEASTGGVYKTEAIYKTEFGHAAGTLSELLHAIDYHEHLNFAQETIHDKGKVSYYGHCIKHSGGKYIVDEEDNLPYEELVDALHAIDRKEA